MRIKNSRLLSRLFFGLLILIQTECFAQAQAEPSTEVKNPNVVADQRSSLKWDFKRRHPSVLKIEKELQHSINVNFTDIPLAEALKFLKEQHGIQIWDDQKALADEGISLDQRITLVVSDVSLKNVLRLLLEPLLLDFVIKNDVLTITSKSVADETFENRVYNTSRIPGLSAVELKEIITTMIEPQRWDDETPGEPNAAIEAIPPKVGGGIVAACMFGGAMMGAPQANIPTETPYGRICTTGNVLVIRQSYRIHEEIAELLEQLEKQQEVRDKTKPSPASSPSSQAPTFRAGP